MRVLTTASPARKRIGAVGSGTGLVAVGSGTGLVAHVFGFIQFIGCPNYVERRVPRSIQPFLAYLLLNRSRFHHRQVLSEALWNGLDHNRAQRRLSTALWRLRRFLEGGFDNQSNPIIVRPGGEVGFNANGHYWLDIEVFERRATESLGRPLESTTPAAVGKLEHALLLYRGDLLEGFYDDWVLLERERLRELYLDCLFFVMRYYERRTEIDRALRYGHTLIGLDPLREDVHRSLMWLYAKRGDRVNAIRQFNRCRETLDSELGIPPMEETQALYSQITASPGAPRQPGPAQMPRAGIGAVTRKLRLAKRSADRTIRSLDHSARQVRRARRDMAETSSHIDESLESIEPGSDPLNSY